MTALTQAEHDVLEKLGDVFTQYVKEVVGRDLSREHDIAEFASHIHVLQHTVMAQAAARAYPTLYRLQGEVLR